MAKVVLSTDEMGLDYGPLLRVLRKRSRMSQLALAVEASQTQASVSQAESGRRIPALPVTVAFLKAMGIQERLTRWVLIVAGGEARGGITLRVPANPDEAGAFYQLIDLMYFTEEGEDSDVNAGTDRQPGGGHKEGSSGRERGSEPVAAPESPGVGEGDRGGVPEGEEPNTYGRPDPGF